MFLCSAWPGGGTSIVRKPCSVRLKRHRSACKGAERLYGMQEVREFDSPRLHHPSPGSIRVRGDPVEGLRNLQMEQPLEQRMGTPANGDGRIRTIRPGQNSSAMTSTWASIVGRTWWR